MTLSSIELWQRITAEGLADSATCRKWAAETAKLLEPAATMDGESVLRKLCDLGKLTGYQARILAARSSEPLHCGPWRIRDHCGQPPWQGWLELSGSAGDDEASRSSEIDWAKCLSAADIRALESSRPSLKRSRQLAAVRAEHLQKVYAPEFLGTEAAKLTDETARTSRKSAASEQEAHPSESVPQLVLRVEPVTGRLLSECFASFVAGAAVSSTIIRQVSEALASLHRAGLYHGRVMPDRIAWDGKQATLLCDPLCQLTGTLDQRATGLLGEHLGTLHSMHFIAPEYISPGQQPCLQSDVYTLGCTWWWLLTGTSLVTGGSPQDILRAHSQGRQSNFAEVELEEPLRWILSHTVAANPAARFPSAEHLWQALLAAEQAGTAGIAGRSGKASTGPSRVQRSAGSTPKRADEPSPMARSTSSTSRATKPAGGPDVELSKPTRAKQDRTTSPQEPATTGRIRRRRKSNNKWMVPVVGGCGFLMVLLLALKFSGVLEPSNGNKRGQEVRPAYVPPGQFAAEEASPSASEKTLDPRLNDFEFVDSTGRELWAPPFAPKPLDISLLPPSAGFFVSLNPAAWFQSTAHRALFQGEHTVGMDPFESIARRAGLQLGEIRRLTIGFYAPQREGDFPQTAIRIELSQAMSATELSERWGKAPPAASEDSRFLAAQSVAYYFGPAQTDNEQISEFAVGPVDLMREVSQLSGAPAPLIPAVEVLWQHTSGDADLLILGSPTFLFTEGRGIWPRLPERLQSQAEKWLSQDVRAGVLQMQFSPSWYVEFQLYGTDDRAAGKIIADLQDAVEQLPDQVERWFVQEAPHPSWRGLAFRLPQMLRSLADYTRYGIEDGVAQANVYLPGKAAPNLLLAGWLALQDGSTLAGPWDASFQPQPASKSGLPSITSVDQYLSRNIRLSFDQEPIEEALRLIEAEANEGLPPGSLQLRFLLDGDAFELAGITRNQQLRGFSIENQPVRVALTELAKLGNPITTVTDTRDPQQQLVWAILPDPDLPERSMISLTTREAARQARVPLPAEFASDK